jgi:hypothetical protein
MAWPVETPLFPVYGVVHVVARDASTEICLSISLHLTHLHTSSLLQKVVDSLSTRSSPNSHARLALIILPIVRWTRPKASLHPSQNRQPPPRVLILVNPPPRHASEGGQARTTTCGRRGTTVTRRAAAESQLGRHRGLRIAKDEPH